MIIGATSPGSLLLHKGTADNRILGRSTKGGTVLVLSISWIGRGKSHSELDSTCKTDKGEIGMKGRREPTAEELPHEEECNRHSSRGDGGLVLREIEIQWGRLLLRKIKLHFGGIEGQIWSRKWTAIGNKNGLGFVLNVKIWGDVLGKLVLLRI